MVRELTLAAQRYGRAGQRDPGDFEAIYNHGLALQELALRSNSSRPQQELLLRQVITPPPATTATISCLRSANCRGKGTALFLD